MPRKLHGKKYLDSQKKIDLAKKYSIDEAFSLLEQVAYAKFDETVEVAFNLGVDPKHADQMVRGAIALPHGTGKTARVVVLARGDKARELSFAACGIVEGGARLAAGHGEALKK